MSEELEVLKIVTKRLNEAGFVYLISGSIAANYYTIPRMTRDIDIVIELKDSDIDKFVGIFEKDFYTDKEMIKKEVLGAGMFNLIHNQYIVKIDFIIRKESEFQESAFLRRKKVIIDDNPMWLISAEDLILAKLSWAKDSHSEAQLRDVSNILKTTKDLNISYLDDWVRRLGLDNIYKDANI